MMKQPPIVKSRTRPFMLILRAFTGSLRCTRIRRRSTKDGGSKSFNKHILNWPNSISCSDVGWRLNLDLNCGAFAGFGVDMDRGLPRQLPCTCLHIVEAGAFRQSWRYEAASIICYGNRQ